MISKAQEKCGVFFLFPIRLLIPSQLEIIPEWEQNCIYVYIYIYMICINIIYVEPLFPSNVFKRLFVPFKHATTLKQQQEIRTLAKKTHTDDPLDKQGPHRRAICFTTDFGQIGFPTSRKWSTGHLSGPRKGSQAAFSCSTTRHWKQKA